MKALSIRQPWAWLILHAGKDIENRSWNSHFRGPFLIHAAAGMTRKEYDNAVQFWRVLGSWREAGCKLVPDVSIPPFEELPRGGIVGVSFVVDCRDHWFDPWFTGEYGFFLDQKKTRPLDFLPMKGMLGFFETGKDLRSWKKQR